MILDLHKLRAIVQTEFPAPLRLLTSAALMKLPDATIEQAVGRVMIGINKLPQGEAYFALSVMLAMSSTAARKQAMLSRVGQISPADLNEVVNGYFSGKMVGTFMVSLQHMGEQRADEVSEIACKTASTIPMEPLMVGAMFGLAFAIDHIVESRRRADRRPTRSVQ
jgi:hypothetical protein